MTPPRGQGLRRREFLGVAGAALAGAALGGLPIVPGSRLLAAEGGPRRKRVLRLAHMTDFHVEPERGADVGMALALHHAQGLHDVPQVILNTGDCVMDALQSSASRLRIQWDIWHRVLKAECSLPIEHCLGNHDVWGWNKKASKTTGSEPGWGKQRALDELGLKSRYRSFDRAGWHFIVLDSIFADGKGSYIGRLDPEQFAWLEADLKRVPTATPVAVMSHIPILSVAMVEYEDIFAAQPRRWAGLSHTDAPKLVRLFHHYPNVKLALSGHLHLAEQIEYAGVTYICGGAVCGDWWRGPHVQTREGYSLVDLFDDGSLDSQYVPYGWKARPR